MSVHPSALALHDMTELMVDLANNFGMKKDLEARTALYYRKLERFPVEVVRKAVDRVLDETHKYFPLVGHIKAYCVEIERELGIVDTSPRATMAKWEADPFSEVVSGTDSDPCPVCGSIYRFSTRGQVIVHDDVRHTEAHLSYSNAGRPEWFEMPPPSFPEPRRKLKQLPPGEPIGDVLVGTLEEAP